MTTVNVLEALVTANANQFQQVMGQVQTTITQVGATTQTLAGTSTTAMTAMQAPTQRYQGSLLGLAQSLLKFGSAMSVFSLLNDAVNLYAEHEQLNVRLKTAVENTGVAFDSQKARIDAIINDGKRLGFTYAAIVESYSLLVTQTDSVEEAIKRQHLAFDLARATGMDLTTASRLLGKVTEENTRVLQRYGIVIRDGATEQEFFAAVLAKVGGQAEAQANTLAVARERTANALKGIAVEVGGAFANTLPMVAAFAQIFESFGIKGKLAALGVAGGLSALKGSLAGLAVELTPIFGILAAVGAGIALPLLLGKIGQAANIPGLKDLGDEFDQIGFIIEKRGLGGLLQGLGEELGIISRQAPPAADATLLVNDAIRGLGQAYEGVMKMMISSSLPAAKAFDTIRQAVKDLGASGAEVEAELKNIRDTLLGTKGLSAVDAMKAFGALTLDSIKSAADSERGKIESLRDSAVREHEQLARFWEDEAARERDFAEEIAKKTKPVMETIDELNKDLGPGFDQRRRRLQAEAAKKKLADDVAEMERKEADRRAHLRPPGTPTLDKLPGATYDEKIALLDSQIASVNAKWDSIMASVKKIVDKMVQDLQDSLDRAQDVLRHKGMLKGEPETPEIVADKNLRAQLLTFGRPIGAAQGDAILAGLAGLGGIKDAIVTAITDGFAKHPTLAGQNPPKVDVVLTLPPDSFDRALNGAIVDAAKGAQVIVNQGHSIAPY